MVVDQLERAAQAILALDPEPVVRCRLLRDILREQGIVLAGPPPHTLIDPVTPDDLRRAVVDLFHNWWAPVLDDSTRLHPPAYQTYAVLTMCRILYTLRHGTVVSKSVAARWAQAALGDRWAALIDRALAWPGVPFDDLPQALDLIRATGNCMQQRALS